jgi:sulfocyanin
MKTRMLSSPTARATLAAGSHEPAILYRGIPTAVAVALLAAVGAPASPAGGSTAPSSEKVDPARKRVALDIVAAFNANNSGLNFNGYYRGDMTVAVPAGWTVDIDFRNNDAVLPHSLVVTRPYGPGHFPEQVGAQDAAIAKAYTRNPEAGIPSPQSDELEFVAAPPGNYYFLCGVPDHGVGGMWTKFKVENEGQRPYVTVAPGAAAGRP